MRLPRFIGLVDLGVATIVVVALVLPARERDAAPATPDPDLRYALALAEARVDAHPGDGAAVEDYGRLLGQAGFKDWAVDATVRATTVAQDSPTAWRALLAASVAYVDRFDVQPGLELADRALAACDRSPDACPSWERVHVQIFDRYLRRGVESKIDPRHHPQEFREAAEGAVHRARATGSTAPGK